MHVRTAWQAHHVVPARVFTEFALAGLGVLAYFLVRGFTETSLDRATANADLLIRFERYLGVFREADIQSLVTHNQFLVDLANWIYIWGHWPVIIVVGVWLVWTRPDRYRLLRNSFLVSGGAGLVVFVLFPVAPPRLVDAGLIDTVTEHSHAYRVLQPPMFVNQYAAMPSLHFGWDLLVGIALFRWGPGPLARVIGVLLPCAMAFAVVATANHYFVDVVAGAAFGLGGLGAALLIDTHREALADRFRVRRHAA